jgi:hypothetical protein|tara:strand:+ start:359 stop:520 length:162 start_codon:yes stop_codon:yes gene_type:complete
MLFRNKDGNVIEINRSAYNTDSEYYKEIMKSKGYIVSTKDNISMKRVLDAIKK